MSPNRRSFVKAMAGIPAIATFSWPAVASASPADAAWTITDLALFGRITATNGEETYSGFGFYELAENGSVALRNGDQIHPDRFLVASASERFTPSEFFQRMITVHRTTPINEWSKESRREHEQRPRIESEECRHCNGRGRLYGEDLDHNLGFDLDLTASGFSRHDGVKDEEFNLRLLFREDGSLAIQHCDVKGALTIVDPGQPLTPASMAAAITLGYPRQSDELHRG